MTESIRVAAEQARVALKELLNDTQHKDHDCGDEEWCPVLHAKTALASLEAALAALPGDDEHERALGEVIDERDTYHSFADSLAEGIAKHLGVDIGEHSSDNNPWGRALIALEDAHSAATPAVESPQIAGRDGASAAPILTDAQITQIIEHADGSEFSDYEFARAIEAALLAHLALTSPGLPSAAPLSPLSETDESAPPLGGS